MGKVMANTKILLFIAMTLSGIAISVLGIKQHMDAAVHQRIEEDMSYKENMQKDMDRFRQQLQLGR